MKLESNPEAGKIVMRGPIGDFEGGVSANDFSTLLAEHDGKDITIEIDSEGGSVTDGLAMFNAIARHDGEVTIHIDPIAASIATVICCAASKVVMNSNAKYFVHRAWTMAMGNCKDFQSTASLLEMMDADIAGVYSERTGLDKDEALALMDAETWMDADEAVRKGFVDEIYEVKSKSTPKAETPVSVANINNFTGEFKNKATRLKLRFFKDKVNNRGVL